MRNIIRQSSWLFLAQSLTRVISFFYTLFLARNLGVEGFGLYTVALSFFSIISSFADFGFNRFLTREVAREKSQAPQLLWNTTVLRLTLTSAIFAVFSVILYLLDPDKMRISLILLATLAILPQSVALTFDVIFVAFQKLQFSAMAVFISSLSTALIGLYLVGSGFGPMGAVNALALGQLIYATGLFFLLQKEHISILSKVEIKILKRVIIGSLPYGLLGMLGLLYFKIDAIMLSYMRGSFETGLYGVAYKFLEAVIFIPGAFAAALFPVLTRLHEGNIKEMKQVYFSSIRLMATVGVLILLLYFFILPELIKAFLPNYLQAIGAIKILSFSIPFIFIATPGVQVLLSTDKYLKQVIYFSILTVAFNVTANFIFIPQYGLLAASWVTVISDIFSFGIFYLFIIKKIFHEKS